MAARFSDPGQWGHGIATREDGKHRWTGAVALDEKALLKPLGWKKPRRIFVTSVSDPFHPAVTDEMLDRLFAVMALAPQHTFQVLTKRPERMRAYCNTLGRHHEVDRVSLVAKQINTVTGFHYTLTSNGWALPNVWLGVSVENQQAADERIPHLLETPAVVRFLSCEPLLGAVDVARWLNIVWRCSYCRGYFTGKHLGTCPDCGKAGGWCGSHVFNGRGRDQNRVVPAQSGRGIDWVIAGGESGPKARPMHPDWARGLRDQCAAAGVPFLFKQWGEWAPAETVHDLEGRRFREMEEYIEPTNGMYRVGKKAASRLLDGVEHNEFPTALATLDGNEGAR